MISIDSKDTKILRALLIDGRKPFAEIANELGTSKDIIWRHYYRMRAAGIIAGATTQVYPRKLGYCGVATIQLNVESGGISNVFKETALNPEAYIFRQYNGRFNVGAIIRFKEPRDLDRLKEVICRNKLVNEIKTYIWTDVRNIPENIFPHDRLLQGSGESETTKSQLGVSEPEIDELDRRIMEALAFNGRASFRKIGHEVGASTDTVSRRYEILKKNNTMKVTIQVNPVKIGYQAILDTSIALTTQSEAVNIVNKISRIQSVSYVLRITGDYDLQVIALVGDCREIMRINDEMEDIPHIKRIEALMRNFRQGYEVWPGPGQHISTF